MKEEIKYIITWEKEFHPIGFKKTEVVWTPGLDVWHQENPQKVIIFALEVGRRRMN